MSANKIRWGVVSIQHQDRKQNKILYEGENIIGRNPNNSDITIKDKSISEAHGKIICQKGVLKIIDTKSKNGIYVHSQDNLIAPYIEIEIKPEDVVYLAQIKCTFTKDPVEANPENIQLKVKTVKPKQSFNEENVKDQKKQEARSKRQVKVPSNLNNQDVDRKESIAKSENSNKSIEKELKDVKIVRKQSAPKIAKAQKQEILEKIEDQDQTKGQERITQKKSKREGNSKELNLQKKNSKMAEKKQEKQKLEKIGSLAVASSNLANEKEKKNEEQKKYSVNKSKANKSDKTDKTEKEKKSLTTQEKEQIKQMKTERSQSQQTKAKGKAKSRINQKQKEQNIQSRKRVLGEEIPSACFHPRRCIIEKRVLMSAFNLSFTPSTKIIIVPNWRDSFDILIMQRYIRTFKLLYAICLGIPVVNSNWIMKSEYQRAIVPIDQFLLQGPPSQKDLISNSVKIAQSGKKVFENLKFYLLQTDKQFHIPFDEIEALIDAGGGSVIKRIDKKSCSQNIEIIMITKLQPNQEDIKSIKKMNYIGKVYTIELVLLGCLTQKINWEQNKVQIN